MQDVEITGMLLCIATIRANAVNQTRFRIPNPFALMAQISPIGEAEAVFPVPLTSRTLEFAVSEYEGPKFPARKKEYDGAEGKSIRAHPDA